MLVRSRREEGGGFVNIVVVTMRSGRCSNASCVRVVTVAGVQAPLARRREACAASLHPKIMLRPLQLGTISNISADYFVRVDNFVLFFSEKGVILLSYVLKYYYLRDCLNFFFQFITFLMDEIKYLKFMKLSCVLVRRILHYFNS